VNLVSVLEGKRSSYRPARSGDQAGWHPSTKLAIPNNISLLPLPAKSPELIPVENIWQFIRDNWLSNRSLHRTEIFSTIAASPGTS
jgi:transposase